MAHIEKRRRARPDGSPGPVHYRVRYRGEDGHERSKSFPRLEDARKFATTTEASLLRGEWLDPTLGRTPFTELAADWLAANPSKRDTTVSRDATVIRVHLEPILGGLPAARIRATHVKTVIDRMRARGLAAKTISTNFGVLRAIMAWAVAAEYIGRSPCRGAQLPEVRRAKKRNATATDVEQLVARTPEQYRAAVWLGAMGLRQAEVFGLHVRSIDFLRRTLTVIETVNEVDGRFVAGDGKTESSQRTISLPHKVVDEVAAHLARTGRRDPDDLVFTAPRGGPVRATNFRNRVYDPAVDAAGLTGLTFHRLRHSAGHIMRELGVPLEVIQQRLGHRSIRTTADLYGSLPESIDRNVADQLDELFADNTEADGVASAGEDG